MAAGWACAAGCACAAGGLALPAASSFFSCAVETLPTIKRAVKAKAAIVLATFARVHRFVIIDSPKIEFDTRKSEKSPTQGDKVNVDTCARSPFTIPLYRAASCNARVTNPLGKNRIAPDRSLRHDYAIRPKRC